MSPHATTVVTSTNPSTGTNLCVSLACITSADVASIQVNVNNYWISKHFVVSGVRILGGEEN